MRSKRKYFVEYEGENTFGLMDFDNLNSAKAAADPGDIIYKAKFVKVGRMNKDGKFIPIKTKENQ